MTTLLDALIFRINPIRYSLLRLLISQDVNVRGDGESSQFYGDANISQDVHAIYKALMDFPVSRRSKLSDQVWDFNGESQPRARNIQGAKSRLDFRNYRYLNSTILFEMKIAFLCALQLPGAIGVGKRYVIPKPHTVIDIFKAVLPFVDGLCARKRSDQGDEYFEHRYFSYADFREKDFAEEAKVFDRAFRPSTAQGFDLLRSHFLAENVFAQTPPYVDMASLEWRQNSVVAPRKRLTQKYFSSHIFEKCSRKATFAIVDFLEALSEPICDTDGLQRARLSAYDAANAAQLTRKNLDIYISIRLGSRGYKGKEIEPFLYSKDPDFWSPRRISMFKDKEALCKLTTARMNEDFYRYITHISNSAFYIIGQYTGMRPSELSGIAAEGCLTRDDFGHDLIVSAVIKNRELVGKIFGDKWAAIPIVKDAVRALQILNRFKQSPYLISRMDTVAPGREDKEKGFVSYTYILCAFLAEVLDFEELEALDVSAYTLRHSLAHQMFRASVGLPFISYQLKHFGNLVSSVGQNRVSAVTIDYGGIGSALVSDVGRDAANSIRHDAEKEFVMNSCDPDGGYVGVNASDHRDRLKTYFKGYLEAGYTKEEIFDRMVESGFAVINVGQGYCYGDATEEFDTSLPCIGSLRCNPYRCKNAVVTKANAPKWREIFVQNSLALSQIEAQSQSDGSVILEDFAGSIAQLKAAIEEAKAVLQGLGEELIV